MVVLFLLEGPSISVIWIIVNGYNDFIHDLHFIFFHYLVMWVCNIYYLEFVYQMKNSFHRNSQEIIMAHWQISRGVATPFWAENFNQDCNPPCQKKGDGKNRHQRL